uniref:C2H2-type domain-containing protein n=1 Tax=Timema tahoe TaxID=61484 RepID=A0A7R9IGD6_9NEOP|nr:unnamed protein product [Timema tahoe]
MSSEKGKSYPPEDFIILKNQTKSYKICGINLEMVGNGFHPINEEIKVEPEDFTPQTTVQGNIPHGGRQLKPRKINTSCLKSKTVCQKINGYDHPNMSRNLRTSTLCKRSKSHLCKVCGKGYTTKGSLSQHINIHKGQRFNCKKCGMTFTYKSNLRSHWLRHLGLRLFKCETCGKNFNQNSNLTRHKMIHEEEILFKCRWCAKSFTQNSYLEIHSLHLTIHSGETLVKSFKCEECGKTFLTKSNLNIHSISHNGLKLHNCELCGKTIQFTKLNKSPQSLMGNLIEIETTKEGSARQYKCTSVEYLLSKNGKKINEGHWKDECTPWRKGAQGGGAKGALGRGQSGRGGRRGKSVQKEESDGCAGEMRTTGKRWRHGPMERP